MIILILKLLEIAQYVIISFFVTLFISDYLNNNIFPLIIPNENDMIINLYLKSIFYLFILSTIFYFINKYVPKIPFILSFLEKYTGYVSSLKNENIRGSSLGISFIYFSRQNNFNNFIDIFYKSRKQPKYI